MHGKSGSGKTEIFRRVSKVYDAPFLRVEATKYTEVGYHGEDVTSIISDLYKKTHSEYMQKDGLQLLGRSSLLKSKTNQHLAKLILGPTWEKHEDLQSVNTDLENGDLEEYNCFLYIQGDKRYST